MRYKTWKTWTVKERRRLALLRQSGLTVARIAEQMRRTHASIRCRLRQEGLAAAYLTRERWLAAFRRPHTIPELMRRFGVSRGAVKQAKRRLRRAGYRVPDAIPSGRAYPDVARPGRCPHGRCPHGREDGLCAACERVQREGQHAR